MDFEKLRNPADDAIQIMWIGHASVLVQLHGFDVLCDPVFSSGIGPTYPVVLSRLLKLFACKRYRKAPCKIEELPNIDVVLISHDHFDHLDYESILKIQQKFQNVKYLVPKGIGKWLIDCGCRRENVRELQWWERQKVAKRDDGRCVFEGEVIDDGTKSERGIRLEERENTLSFACTPAQHWCQRGATDLNTVR